MVRRTRKTGLAWFALPCSSFAAWRGPCSSTDCVTVVACIVHMHMRDHAAARVQVWISRGSTGRSRVNPWGLAYSGVVAANRIAVRVRVCQYLRIPFERGGSAFQLPLLVPRPCAYRSGPCRRLHSAARLCVVCHDCSCGASCLFQRQAQRSTRPGSAACERQTGLDVDVAELLHSAAQAQLRASRSKATQLGR